MHTSAQLIELAKNRLALAHNLPTPMTDYRFSKLARISTQVISGWHKKGRIGGEFAPLFAQLCELPEPYVYACLEHERATPEIRRILENIAAKFATRAAAVVLSAAMILLGSCFTRENAAFAAAFNASDYTLCVLLRRLRRYARAVGRGWHRAATFETVTNIDSFDMA